MKIDSHLHFWHYEPVKDAWITDEMQIIKNDFMLNDSDLAVVKAELSRYIKKVDDTKKKRK